MNISQNIAEKLLQIKAIKLNSQNPFTWASGLRSPIYCDNRITLSYPEIRTLIKESFKDSIDDLEAFDVVAGVATAGIAHGALLADYLNKPFIYVRGSSKGHGRKNQIEGEINPGQTALVIEDLISTGGSSIKACEILMDSGIKIDKVMAIFDYQFDIADENFKNANIKYKTLSNYGVLLHTAMQTGYINIEEKEILDSWNKNPKEWFDNI
jgi:orotate phosphoribosyltransferase